MFLLNTTAFSISIHTHMMMIQVSDAVIICWWGAASPAQWECVSVIRQTICAGPEAEKKDSSRLVHLSIF